MPTNAFGPLLRAARKATRLSQRKLADLVEVHHTYLSKLENDRLPPPSVATITRLAEECGVPAAKLLIAAGRPPAEVLEAALRSARQTLWEFRHASPHEEDCQIILQAVREIDEVLNA